MRAVEHHFKTAYLRTAELQAKEYCRANELQARLNGMTWWAAIGWGLLVVLIAVVIAGGC